MDFKEKKGIGEDGIRVWENVLKHLTRGEHKAVTAIKAVKIHSSEVVFLLFDLYLLPIGDACKQVLTLETRQRITAKLLFLARFVTQVVGHFTPTKTMLLLARHGNKRVGDFRQPFQTARLQVVF